MPASCPIPTTHTRLERVHRLWHQAEESYFSPEAFCTNLNACIQEIRNVTFILQSEKSGIKDFAQWYAGWQQRMKQDSLMTWLKDARNVVVKRGDLEMYSEAIVRLVGGGRQEVLFQKRCPPLMTTCLIAEWVKRQQDLPADLLQRLLLVFERRWVAEQQPQHELLDVLAHGYGFLSRLIDDLHVQLDLADLNRTTGCTSGRLPCMEMADEHRTLWVRATDGSPVEQECSTEDLERAWFDSAEAKEVMEHYKLEGDFFENWPQDLEGRLLKQSEFACRVLSIDGYHAPTVFVAGNPPEVQLLQYDTPAEQQRAWYEIARSATRTSAKEVIFVSEVWSAPVDSSRPFRLAEESPERREALVLVGANSAGEEISVRIGFNRTDRGLHFYTPKVNKDSHSIPLAPVRALWGFEKE